MRSRVSSTCGFSAASIAASERLPTSSSSSSGSSRAGGSTSVMSRSGSSSSSRPAAAGRGAAGVADGACGCAAASGLTAASTLSTSSASIDWPKVVSRSITSRSMIASSSSSSRQTVIAWKVSGLSQSPRIMVLRPASMRLAMAISPSRDSSSTEPISRRYIRTGSSVRSSASPPTEVMVRSREPLSPSPISGAAGRSSSSPSSDSWTVMPISDSIAITSSICSEVTWSGGSTSLSSS